MTRHDDTRRVTGDRADALRAVPPSVSSDVVAVTPDPSRATGETLARSPGDAPPSHGHPDAWLMCAAVLVVCALGTNVAFDTGHVYLSALLMAVGGLALVGVIVTWSNTPDNDNDEDHTP